MASDNPTCDFGQFDSNRLWQYNESNPFGSLIELAYKLKRVNREFKKLYLSTYESCAKLRQGLYTSDIDGLGCKYNDVRFGTDFALSRVTTYQGNSDGRYSNKFGSDLKQKSRFSLETQSSFVAASKKSKIVKNVRAFRRKLSNDIGDVPFYAKVSVDDLSTRKSARIENLLHDLQQKHNCPLCFYQTDNRCHLRRHLSSVHNATKPYYCYICKKEFSRSERVKGHFLNIHPEITYSSKIARKELYLQGDQKESMDTAVAMPEDAAITPAPMETAEDLLSVKCADSESELSVQKSWERYCQISSQPFDCQKIFTCRQCNFGGGDIWLMKKHYLDVHLGATTYVCRICRYTSSCVARLVSHMLGHGELICSYCSYSTAEVKLFEKHLKECSLLSRCPLCKLDFADKIQLQEHTLSAHQLFRCKECSFSSSSSSELDAHLGVHATSNSTLIQEIESDDEVLLGPYRSRAEIQDSNASATSKRQSNVAVDGSLISTAATETDTAAAVEQKWNRVEEKMLDKVLAKVNASNVFSCLVPGCGFQASWKKSLDLHTENYHGSCNPNGDQANAASSEKCTRNQNSAESLASGFFPCPFCPNSRTFKYRKSFEKHLGQHGLDHLRHPNLIARLNRKFEQVSSDHRDIQ